MRFASRFSRARVRAASAAGGPYVQRGEAFGGFWGNLGFRVFLGNSEKVAPGAGSPYLVSKTAPSRARFLKNILAGLDGLGGPPEPSGPVRMFFMGRGREGAV